MQDKIVDGMTAYKYNRQPIQELKGESLSDYQKKKKRRQTSKDVQELRNAILNL